ncbi:hypothetical protein JCM6882_006738 [Rhodosporidiobolus microsporus]
MSAASPPPLPRRPEQALPPADDIPDDPPPAYEATPSGQEQALDYGPTRPFQPPVGPPPRATFAPPPHPPPNAAPVSPQPTGGSSLGPPQFPFWNGAGLTPHQTGFSEGPIGHANPYASSPYGPPPPSSSSHTPYSPPSGPPPSHPSLSPSSSSSSPGAPQIPPLQNLPNPNILADDRSSYYDPASTPTPGQPYLNGGRLLVYPVGSKICPKCSNTGYKPFDPYTGYRGDDPAHPCRQCWKKHSRPFSGPLATSCSGSTHQTIPSNYQRPLRLLQTPATAPPRPNVTVTSGAMYMPRQPGSLVVRPGDPRMGGVLCRRCGGDGLEMGMFIFDETTCSACGGAGRVFI